MSKTPIIDEIMSVDSRAILPCNFDDLRKEMAWVRYDQNHKIEDFLETVGMWCEQCPAEVQQAFHALGRTEQHYDHPIKEPR